MDLEFETPDGSVFSVEVWFFATVLEIKESAQKLRGFPVSKQRLSFNNCVLENDKNTEYYSLLQGSRILLSLQETVEASPHLHLPPRHRSALAGKRMRVLLELPRAETRKIAVEVNPQESVRELRKMAGGVLPESVFFVFKQNVMDEDRSFRWHNVQNGDTIGILNGTVK